MDDTADIMTLMPRAWHELANPFHCRMTRDAFLEGIVNRYAEPHRHYHTLEHVADMLATLDEHRSRIEEYEALAFATWFHDVIYDPTRDDNEERSATLARRTLRRLQVPSRIANRAEALIIATKDHESPDASFDAGLFLDADLAILGASATRYAKYAAAIRKEFSAVDDATYRRGRTEHLESFLQRDHIYATDVMRARREAQARENITTELRSLAE